MKYLVYSVWMTHRIVEAENEGEALGKGEPTPLEGQAMVEAGYNLANWYAVPIEEQAVAKDSDGTERGS